MTWESEELRDPELDPARVRAIRARAHAVLAGRAERAPPLELALVVAFSVLVVAWAMVAVSPLV